MNFDENLKNSFGQIKPDERDASFDYCFNYFQGFRESGKISLIASDANLQTSCLQLGFYLASWGMYRGSARLFKKSARRLVPIIRAVAGTAASFWEIDVDSYDSGNIERIIEFARGVRHECSQLEMSDTLITKIMLGVFGNVPAFDSYFVRAARAEGIRGRFDQKALEHVKSFYLLNSEEVEIARSKFRTLNFLSGERSDRSYTRAKLIDMAFFAEGELMLARLNQ